MARSATRRFLASAGLPDHDLGELPDSAKRFPDGAHYRVEIPSTEGPRAFAAVLEEAERRGVPVVRVSQGSGVFMHTDEELDEMASLGASAGVEVSLFARPNAGWDTSAMARAPVGPLVAPAARGTEQLVAVLEDVRRAAAHGIRSVLIQDLGALSMFAAMRAAGELPSDMQAKVSVMLPVANPASARVIADLGANTINLPTDLTLAQIAAIRAAIDVPLDIYVECPDNLGGFVRFHEIADIVRVAAPVYLKFGLRGTTDPYPAGTHVESQLVAFGRERVRRARLALDLLGRLQDDETPSVASTRNAPGLAVPSVARAVVA
ncbi:MAG: U32 family peptidase [Candidatus Limnocylindria bacterium]